MEVCINGYWRHICDNGWDTTRAMVVCKQLFGENIGKSTVLTANPSSLPISFPLLRMLPYSVASPFSYGLFGSGVGTIKLSNITCNGSPSRLVDCTYNLVQGYYSGVWRMLLL